MDKDIRKIIIDTLVDFVNNMNPPSVKQSQKSVDITDIRPIDLLTFMKKNNIPDDAYFDGVDNGYDGWYSDRLLLSWYVDVPTTDDDKRAYIKKIFNTFSNGRVCKALLSIGINRRNFDSYVWRKYVDQYGTDYYAHFINGEYDILIGYYKLLNDLDLDLDLDLDD